MLYVHYIIIYVIDNSELVSNSWPWSAAEPAGHDLLDSHYHDSIEPRCPKCNALNRPLGDADASRVAESTERKHTTIWKVYFYHTQTVQHSAYLFIMK